VDQRALLLLLPSVKLLLLNVKLLHQSVRRGRKLREKKRKKAEAGSQELVTL